MYNLKELLEDIEYETNGEIIGDVNVSSIVTNSREVTPQSLFICLKGCRSDGHNYVKEAERRGAVAIVCSSGCRYKSEKAVFIRTENTRAAYSRIWRNAEKKPDKRIKLIGITGTNGKTTVSTMIYTALNKAGRKCALIGTLGGYYGNEKITFDTMTTPDPEKLYPIMSRFAELGAEYAVMEVSSHSLSLNKLEGVSFFVGAITNLTPEHLDYHGNMSEYCKAKALLFDKCEKKLFCTDDVYTTEMYQKSVGEKKRVSVKDKEANYYADNVIFDGINGVSLDFAFNGGKIELNSKIPGQFTVSNVLLAGAVLKELGLTSEEIKDGIAALEGVKGRMEKLPIEENFSVIIDFAHTPDALQKLLESVNAFKRSEQRVVTLFGCGGDRDKSKRSLMGAIASRLSDMVIITEDNSRSERKEAIIDDILTGIDKKSPHKVIFDRGRAIKFAIENAGKGDIILLCGKGHEEYEIDKSGKRAFSEREIVYSTLRKRKGNSLC